MSVQRIAGGTVAVFLNYRTAPDTIAAVRSLKASQTQPAAIIVVDNASNDGSIELLRRTFEDVHVIASATNNGFSAGCNLGIGTAQQLGADRILLLNSDVVVRPDALGVLERALSADGRLGIVGPVVVSFADPDRIQSSGISYSLTTGRMRVMGHNLPIQSLAPFEQRDVDAVSGCAMLIDCGVFERVGVFAEEFFFGFEDLDFCLRARAAGFRCACVRRAVVQHEENVTIGRQSALRIYFATRNHLLLAARVSARRSVPVRWFQAASILALNLAHVLLTSNVPRREGLRGWFHGVRDHLMQRYGAGSASELAPERFA